jgi:hypothetical protein
MAAKEIREMSADQLHARWRRHVAKATDDIWFLLDNRAKFRDVLRMFNDNPELNPLGRHAFAWLARLWSSDALMAVRRELDDQHGVINLKQTMHEMEPRPEALTRSRFLEWLDVDIDDYRARKRANRLFESYGYVVAGPRHDPDPYQDYIDAVGIAKDRREMEFAARPAFRYAQMLIAHRTPMDHLEISIPEMDKAIDAIANAAAKYSTLLLGESFENRWGKLPRDWAKAFKLPWHVKR